MTTRTIRAALLALTAVLLAAVLAAPAQAVRVANPGPVSLTFQSGSLVIGDNAFEAASDDDPITAGGTVAADGTVRLTSLAFPPIEVENTLGLGPNPIIVTILPRQIPGQPAGTVGFGTLNPLTGQSNVQVRAVIRVGPGLGGSCGIGENEASANPIILNLTTGTTSPPGPNTPITGTPYNSTTGAVTVVDNAFAVPGAGNCSLIIDIDGQINSELGLPSAAGRNTAILTAVTSPIVQPGVRASFVANPSTGPAPLGVSFDASASTVTTPSRQYRWDYTNDGTIDFVTSNPTDPAATFTYTTPGTYTARLVVADADGDTSSTTRTITVAVPLPDVAVTKVGTDPPFVTGETEEYVIGVSNVGSLATTGPVTVTDVLPTGMTYTGFTGAGWSCSEGLGVVTCEHAGSIPIGAAADDLHLQVVAGEDAVGFPSNTATASTADDPNASNDSATDVVQVVRAGIDLTVEKELAPEDPLLRGQRSTYVLDVFNVGTQPTTERIRIVDTLPAGVTYVGASGNGWTCFTTDLPTLRCFTDEVLAPGDHATPLRIRVEVDSDAPDAITNTVTVSTAGDSGVANDADTHVGSVSGYAADFSIDKSHAGDFVIDQQGSYTLRVRNVGTRTAANPVTVTDLLPDGLTPVSAGGPADPDAADWSCGIAGQLVTCEHPGPVEAGVELEALTIAVAVGEAAAGTVTNTASLSSADDHNPGNDSDADDTLVRSPQPDLSMDKSHAAAQFTVGSTGTYVLDVTNAAGEPTRGTITVVDDLPAGLTLVSASGPGWTCGPSGGDVSCTRATPIAGLASSSITVVVAVGPAAAGGVTNVATVSAPNDTNPANDRDEDPTAIRTVPLPTTITAEGAVATIDLIRVRIGLDGVRAKLTSGTSGVPGRRLDFRTANGTFICSAVTDGSGTARCGTVLLTMVQAALGSNYSATFTGDDSYAPATGLGPVVKLPKITL